MASDSVTPLSRQVVYSAAFCSQKGSRYNKSPEVPVHVNFNLKTGPNIKLYEIDFLFHMMDRKVSLHIHHIVYF